MRSQKMRKTGETEQAMQINAFKDTKDKLEARLNKLEITQDYQTDLDLQ